MKPVPINYAEAVIEAFWDTALSDIDCYDFRAGKGTGACCKQGWCYVEFSWHRATPGKPIFSMSRDVDIIIEHYDRWVRVLPVKIHLHHSAHASTEQLPSGYAGWRHQQADFPPPI
jgi:hypothetical protein